MKRLIYLTRHGDAGPMDGRSVCCGRFPDDPLNRTGITQAEFLALGLEGIPANRIYCSMQKRSKETARILSGETQSVIPMEELGEIGMGVWEGLDFDDIRKSSPKLYAERAGNHALQPPGGEAYEAAAERMCGAVKRILKESRDQEAIIISAHCGVNRALLCKLSGIPFSKNRSIPQPHACVNVLEEWDGALRPLSIGMSYDALPDENGIYRLLDEFRVEKNIREHMEAVAELALEMNQNLEHAGASLDGRLIQCSALLHDMCRSLPHHEKMAAMELRRLGYLRLARVVELHHGGEFRRDFDEAQLLFLADKMVSGTACVSIEERFALSAEKCRTQQARAAHAGRLLQTRQTAKKYEELLCGKAHAAVETEKDVS